jgi:hypothetical protein
MRVGDPHNRLAIAPGTTDCVQTVPCGVVASGGFPHRADQCRSDAVIEQKHRRRKPRGVKMRGGEERRCKREQGSSDGGWAPARQSISIQVHAPACDDLVVT